MITNNSNDLPPKMIENYLGGMINQFFKILPIKESGEPSLIEFMESFQVELLGFKELMTEIGNDSMFVTLLSILQYLIDNSDCDIKTVKREVFKAINICKKLQRKYRDTEER